MASLQKAPRTADWSNISSEILSAIRKRLQSNLDILTCRSVCKNWRASINPNPNPSLLSPFLPCKISNPTLPFNSRPNDSLLLVARTVFLVHPIPVLYNSTHWILTVEEVIQGKLRILYPLSKNHVTSLPSNFPKSLNLLDFCVTEVAKSYGFKYASDGKDVSGVHKVVLCSGSTAMVLYGGGTLIGVRLKNGKWGYVRESLVNAFSDVISFKGTVCAVDHKGHLHSVDYKTMKVIKTMVVKLPDPHTRNPKRLVERKGELWLVAWPCIHGNFSMERVEEFKVYSLGELHSKRLSQTRLQDLVLFVSLDCCFLLCAQVLHLCGYAYRRDPAVNPFSYKSKSPPFINELRWYLVRGDYLVYSQDCFDSSDVHLSYNHQLFEEASVSLPIGVFYFQSEDKDKIKSHCGTIAGVLWPPPTWFLPDTYTSSGDEEEKEELLPWGQDVSTHSKGEFLRL